MVGGSLFRLLYWESQGYAALRYCDNDGSRGAEDLAISWTLWGLETMFTLVPNVLEYEQERTESLSGLRVPARSDGRNSLSGFDGPEFFLFMRENCL